MAKEDDIGELVDFAKLVGGELSKIDKMSMSDKSAQAYKLDINKIIPKKIEPVVNSVSSSTPQNISQPNVTINRQQQVLGQNLILEELIKMNQKFDLLLAVFQKKKKRRKQKPKSLLNKFGISADGQPNTNNNPK